LFSATYFLEFLFYFQKTTKTVTNVEELHEPHDVVGQETNMSKSHRKFNFNFMFMLRLKDARNHHSN
jgi:hypothetical protein